MKKIVSWSLVLSILISGIFFDMSFKAYALNVGNGATVTNIGFTKRHNGFDVVGGTITISGSALDDVNILFEIEAGNPKALAPTDSSPFLKKYQLTPKESDSFTGRIYIGNQVVNLDTPNFPNIIGADKAIVNQEQNQALVLSGSKLNTIDNATIKATYGRGIQKNNIVSGSATVTPNQITFTPVAPSSLGSQDIIVSQTSTNDPAIEVTYTYKDAFSIFKDLDLAPASMYPNAASKGDTITLTSNKFADSKNYAVYFLNTTDNDFAFSDEKKSPSVILSADKKRLSVEVPNTAIDLGSKRIVIVEIVSGEIISRFDVPETFSLIDAAFKPIIQKINPNKGTDEGAKVQIIGRNIVSPVIPELNSATGKIKIDQAMPRNGNTEMNIDYDETGLTFKNIAVATLTRKVRAIIAKKAFFELNPDNTIKYSQIGPDDNLYIITDIINDAATSPKKDVVVEIDTEIEDVNGNTYLFNQRAIVKNGFEFIPSSVEPFIERITPEKVQISQTFTPKEHTLFSIEGNNFMVDKYTTTAGTIKTNYPVVTFQITDTLGDGDYIVKFDKNDTTAGPEGSIYDSNGVKMGIPVEMVVLNSQNQVVDGSIGNSLGTKILLYLPKNISVSSGGKKNVQVINPKRSSDNLGTGYVALDIVDFVIASDTPVIESVNPSIVTADSREEIIVTGSNFQDGVKVYIDGVDVGTVKREISPQGNSVTLTFNAPVGRVTETQLQVVNPLGGIAVRDFFYVQSFNQDPSIVSVSPDKGTTGTLTVVKGDNFFKPNAAVESTDGLDAYKLLGTRVLIDGVDVNRYNLDTLGNIKFIDYIAPSSVVPLFSNEVGKIKLTPFYNNAVVTSADDLNVYEIVLDSEGNPQFYDGSEAIYTFKYNATDGYLAYKADGTLAGGFSATASSVSIDGGPTFKVRMNNQLIRADYNLNRELSAELSDYWHSVILQDENSGEFYTLQKQTDDSLRLSDGQFNVFNVKITGSDIDSPNFKAFDKTSNAYDVTMSDTKLVVATATPLNLKVLTPFEYDSATRRIIGNRIKVETKDKLQLIIPNLISSTGYKDITVVNPDTKSATLIKGFYYFKLPATQPIISTITPNLGAISGGYVVTIEGKDFNNTTQVFFDGIQADPAGKQVSLDGMTINVKVPPYPFDITEVFGVGALTVPVVVVNSDGGSAQIDNGFTFVKPTSTPKVNEVVLSEGSTNGGEVVEILGADFRFFEPYENIGGGAGYDIGIDRYTNINGSLDTVAKWDDLLANRYDGSIDLWQQKSMPDGASYFGYDYYYSSPILPRVYFGGKLAKIVDFDKGYIKVITPQNTPGTKNVIVMNNDAGVSNSGKYTYKQSSPTVTYINPNQGARMGGERREVIGSGFAKDTANAYQDDVSDQIVNASDKVQSLVRFGDISNEKVNIGQANDGRINANRATVKIEGGLTVSYDGNAKMVTVSLEEGGIIYKRTFTNYEKGSVFIPTGMLKNGNKYYQPANYGYSTPTVYNKKTDYEWVRVNVDATAKRLFVSRGYSPEVHFETAGKLVLKTPAYYTIDTVNTYVYNPDGGIATTKFIFTNPDSSPIIQAVRPSEVLPAGSIENNTDKDQLMVQASIQGGVDIEIKGRDFRDGVKVFLGTKEAIVQDIIKDESSDLQVIIAKVPKADAVDIGVKMPIIIENTDGGIANSTDVDKLGTDKRLIYFIYRKPLSLPSIKEIVPSKTSQYGGNKIEIRGTDFRSGARVIIGSVGGVPVSPYEIEDVGRYIKFKVPSNLTPGSKDVQVINADYGTDTLSGGLTIISYPKVKTNIYDIEDEKVYGINTEGAQKIVLKGENFMPGAKVIFGGKHVLKVEGVTGEEGFYKDDKIYIVQGGVPAQAVEFVDANTLIVTTPKVYEEKDYNITVINSDTGLSDGETVIKVRAPVPNAPTSLKVTLVNNQYVKLYNYETKNVKYYEIYVYLGNKSITTLKKNDYKDFKSLGTTTYVPHKITRLAGIDKLSSKEKAFFVVKAVNEFGTSKFSNIAYLKHKEFKEIDNFGEVDKDGGILPTISEISETSYSTNHLKILFTADRFSQGVMLNLRDNKFKTMDKIDVIMPDNMVQSNYSSMYLLGDFLDLTYSPAAFNNVEFKRNNTKSSEYVTWTTTWRQTAATSSALSQLPRKIKAVSPIVKMSVVISNNTGTRDLGVLETPIVSSFNLTSPKITQKTGDYSVYYFNNTTKRWQKINATYSAAEAKVAYSTTGSGYYVLTVTY